jgi:hypothetical protein
MAGLLRPYVAFELVSRLKEAVDIPIHMQCHATTGLSTATCVKAAEAGIDNIDTAISSMSMTYGHSPTESLVAILEGTDRDTGLDLQALEEVATYFREVRKKYAKFEGGLRGVDSRILVAQVPAARTKCGRQDRCSAGGDPSGTPRSRHVAARNAHIPDCRDAGSDQRSIRVTLRDDYKGDSGSTERRVRRDAGRGEQGITGTRTRGCRAGDLPPCGPAGAGG